MAKYLVWLAALIVLLAGCAGGADAPTSATTESHNRTPTASPLPTATTSPTPTPTATPTPDPALDNPWEKETIVVGISDFGRDRDFEQMVRKGVAFWTAERMAQHADYQVEFVIDPDADDPDIDVRVRDAIDTCGMTTTLSGWLGCAPVLTRDDEPDDPVLVEISAAQTDTEFALTVAHEFGHVVGITHGGTPTWLMTHDDVDTSATNATDRPHPWNHTGDIKVFVRDGFEDQQRVERGVTDAVRYYNRHDSYLPDGTRVVEVDHWYEADIIFQNRSPTGVYEVSISPGSQPYLYGLDWDSDDALEWYTVTYIYIEGAEELDIEYHAGHWIGRLVNNDADELPSQYQS